MGTSDESLVQLTRVLRAPPGEVFVAWTDPALLERWWIGVGGWVDAKADVDLRVGGRYHLSMRDDGGALHGVFGVYTDVALVGEREPRPVGRIAQNDVDEAPLAPAHSRPDRSPRSR